MWSAEARQQGTGRGGALVSKVGEQGCRQSCWQREEGQGGAHPQPNKTGVKEVNLTSVVIVT